MMRLGILGNDDVANAVLRHQPRLHNTSLIAGASVDSLLAENVDGIFFCTAAGLESNWRAAVDARQHLLVPVPASEPLLADIKKACDECNLCLMPCFPDRFLPSIRAVKESADSGKLGIPGLIRIHRWQSQAQSAANGTADLDLAVWMFGGTLPDHVYALARRAAEDQVNYLQVHLGFPLGGMGLIDITHALPAATSYFSLSLIGSCGAAYSDDHHNQQLLFQDQRVLALKTGEGDAAQLALLQEFSDCIREKRAPSVTFVDAQNALLLGEAVQLSLAAGRVARRSGQRYAC